MLREQGYSYGYILKKLNLTSKGTLSGWFKNITLTEKSQQALEANKTIAIQRGLSKFNKDRSALIQEENKKCQENGRDEIKIDSKKDLLIAGTALYWGEGTKYEAGGHPSLVFTNSDPDMIHLYMKFLRDGLSLDETVIKAGVHLHPFIKV